MVKRFTFSQRKGIGPMKTSVQIDSMDDDLRNGLWNALTMYYWNDVGYRISSSKPVAMLMRRIWLDSFKEPLDTLDDRWPMTHDAIRGRFFSWSWNRVYDFVEFVASSDTTDYPTYNLNERFIDYCNTILEREISAYRFVGGVLTQITTVEEIKEVEEALAVPPRLKPAAIHIRRSLELLSDRKAPDFRNSIKEAISGVESVCSVVVGAKATMGQALDRIGQKVPVHSALKRAFDSLYGYSSNADGIRHALMDEPSLSFEDAKFMLVSCAAFINYLKVKASKAGVKL